MHVPNPLGSYPLVLRDYDVSNPRGGELLLNYENSDLYYVNRKTGEVKSVAQDIYEKIMEAMVQNSHFDIVDKDKHPEIEKDEYYPPLNERSFNHFYYVVNDRTEFEVDE